MQLSFKVKTIDHLCGLNHGNALSIYCMDPEENTVEVYLDTPWYVSQPHGDPLDLDEADEAIWAQTEHVVRSDPSFMSAKEWAARFARRGEQLKTVRAPGERRAISAYANPQTPATATVPARRRPSHGGARVLARDAGGSRKRQGKPSGQLHASVASRAGDARGGRCDTLAPESAASPSLSF